MLTCQVSNGAEHTRKQQRSDLNVPLENNNVPEVGCCWMLCGSVHLLALLQGHLHFGLLTYVCLCV